MSLGGGGTQRVINELSPTQAPFVEYGLNEAQRLYGAGMPSFFPDQTYVGPSEQTQTALEGMQNRALEGNPLVPAGQQQFLDTIQGTYLGATNPYFQQRFQTAADAATQNYFDTVNQINSQASMAGRYGSGAQADLMDRAQANLAQSLSNTAGDLAFQNYAQERGRQLAAAQLAPVMAETDYADLERLAQLGQVTEGYQDMSLQDSINRFNFQQNLPSMMLDQYLNAAYGAPMGSIQTSAIPRGGVQGLLGGLLAGGALQSSIPAGATGAMGALAANPFLLPLGLGLLASQ